MVGVLGNALPGWDVGETPQGTNIELMAATTNSGTRFALRIAHIIEPLTRYRELVLSQGTMCHVCRVAKLSGHGRACSCYARYITLPNKRQEDCSQSQVPYLIMPIFGMVNTILVICLVSGVNYVRAEWHP